VSARDSRGGPDIVSWVENVARRLVDRPESVTARLVHDEDAEVVELGVAQEEMGRVIGRQGRTVQAMRALLDLAGEKHDRNYDLDIVE
jgi:predicted RNA-binding protein YlqC (UPF0109 family)